MSDAIGKKISDLRVIDLRLELEKRGLDRNGIKGVLIERLTQALVKEGANPDNYVMEKEAPKPEVPTAPNSQGKLNLESTASSVKVKIEPPLIELEDDEGQTDSYDQVEGGDAIANDEEQTDSVEVNDDDADDVDADAEANVGEDGDAEGIPDKTVEAGDVETGDVEVDEADVNNDNDEAIEIDGAGKEDESGYECSEEQEDKFDEEEGGNEEEQEGDEDLDEKEDEELDTTENNNESVEEVLDDDLDEDALHLTIGDDEEEDKNYILDEEREKDKTGDKKDGKEDPNLVACSDKQSETADISQNKKTGTAKVKTAAKKETKGVKLTSSAKVKQIKSNQQTHQAASSPSKEGKSLAVSASKKDEKGGAGEPAKPDVSVSEKRADSHSVVKVKVNKNQKEKDGPKKDVNKGPVKDVRSEVSKKIDNRRINPKNRFPRTPYEKPIRIPMNRPKQRRSMSPRMRRPSFPIHQQQRQTLSFEHIREMRERERQREREREMHRRMRERERREREEIARQREIERRNAEQLELLERERQRLRVEREKVEREKEELIRMERERQRAERERIEREKEEIRRAKLDDRNRRNQKRSFDEERDDSREYVDRKKLVTAEARRLERPYHEQQLQHVSGSSRGNNITTVAAVDRREPEAVRHERGHHHRSDSRGFSPVRETIHGRVPPRPPIIHDRGASARDWRYSVELQKESHHREKEPVKEKRSDDRRQMRVAREREIPSVAPTAQKARIQTDYSVARNDSAQHHRNSVLPKGRGTDRFDVGKNEPSYAIARDDSWMRRYDTPSTIQVTSSQSSIPLSGRDNWMPAERKLDWSVNDRISVRPSMPEMQDRWISGSGGTLNSALRTSSMATGHIGQLVSVPPVIYNQHAAMTISGDSISSQPYSSDRYSAYGKQSMHMRRY